MNKSLAHIYIQIIQRVCSSVFASYFNSFVIQNSYLMFFIQIVDKDDSNYRDNSNKCLLHQKNKKQMNLKKKIELYLNFGFNL